MYVCMYVCKRKKCRGALLRLPGRTVRGNLRRRSLYSLGWRVVRPLARTGRFLTCLVNSYTLIGRTLPVIVPFLFSPGKRKGSCGPLLRLPGKTDRGNLRWWILPLLGLTRCELVWLAQNALLSSHCTGDLFRTDVPSYLFLSGGSHLITQRLASRSAKQNKYVCMYVCVSIYVYQCIYISYTCSGTSRGGTTGRPPGSRPR